jgi:methionine biosynthesis protein MetW
MEVQAFENTRWGTKPQQEQFRHTAALKLIKGGLVLDVGCGDGFFLSLLKKAGLEAEGIDISDIAVAHARDRGLTARQGDFAREPLPFKDHSFSTVVALDVLEHVYDPLRVLEEMKRVTAGTIIISVPNFSSLPSRLQTLLGKVPENNRPHKGHIYWFNWLVLSALLQKSGLTLLRTRINAPWGLTFLGRIFPNLFALSYVIETKPHA